MWANNSVFYQIYPLGFCGAPFENDGNTKPRILKVIDWIGHMKKLGADAVYFSPVFESDTHGYNTRDYRKLDCRLGSNEDFVKVCEALHEAGMKVVLDGVFNHVGRGFWAFQDVLKNRENSRYRDWFHIDFSGNSNDNDGLWYEGWEGNYDLVRLNLQNEEVIGHILDSVKYWVETFDIDGLRLDVAYCLDWDFLKRLRQFTDTLKEDFFLVGEVTGGDYRQWANDEMCHSVTNYECYNVLHSGFNNQDLSEFSGMLEKQFGMENPAYAGMHLFNFVDNHDVSRIASCLADEKFLMPIYAVMFAMPGIPCVYYGSEWGAKGNKSEGDPALRACFDEPEFGRLAEFIARLAEAKKNSRALREGSYRQILQTGQQWIFERACSGERVLVAINLSDESYTAHFDAGCGLAEELISGSTHDFGGGSELAPCSVVYWKMER